MDRQVENEDKIALEYGDKIHVTKFYKIGLTEQGASKI